MISKYAGKETSIDCPRLAKIIPGKKAIIHATIYFENSLHGDYEPTGHQGFWCESSDKCGIPVLGTGGIDREQCHFWRNKLQYLENFNY